MPSGKGRLTFHVMLQLDKIHRSQRPFCVIRGGHADQPNEQKEKDVSLRDDREEEDFNHRIIC